MPRQRQCEKCYVLIFTASSLSLHYNRLLTESKASVLKMYKLFCAIKCMLVSGQKVAATAAHPCGLMAFYIQTEHTGSGELSHVHYYIVMMW